MAFRIEPMSPADTAAVVALQVAFLDGSIVTQLGPRFLTRMHMLTLQHESTRAYVARDVQGGGILGFAVASVDVHAYNQYVKPRVLPSLVQALLLPPRIGLLGAFARMAAEGEPQPPIDAELLLLTVDARARRQGVGRALLEAIEAAFAAHGVSRYRVAVRSQLAEARAFYSASAFEHEQERQVLGRPMVYLTKQVVRH